MINDYILGVGLIARALGELLVDKNPSLAFTDFMKGLGQFGVHSAITVAMQTPAGKAMSLPKSE